MTTPVREANAPLCAEADIAVGQASRFAVASGTGTRVEVAVVRDDEGTLHAISDVCSHGQVSLSDGDVEGCTIECWLHGSQFDLRTGAPTGLPATKPVPVYPLTIVDGQVFVDVDAPLAS